MAVRLEAPPQTCWQHLLSDEHPKCGGWGMPRILSICRKTQLRITRDDTLAASGYTVISPQTPDEAHLLVAQQPVEAVVIGHFVSAEDRKRIIPAIRSVCKCPVVFVYSRSESSEEEPLADVCVDLTDGIEPLLSTLERLTSKKIA